MFATLRGPGMLRRAALGTAGVVAFGIAGRHQAIALSSSTPSDAALGALWGEAIDGMIDVAAMWRTRPAWPASAAQASSLAEADQCSVQPEARPGAERSLRRARWPRAERPCFHTQVPGANELSHDGMLYLAPMGSAGTPPRPVKWPKLIGKSVVYSLTAWNPMGRDAPQRCSVEPQSWLSLRPAGSPEASLSAGARLRLPQARASLGQSAGWAVLLLAWHMPHRACFRHRYEQNVEANQKLQADLVDWKGNPSPRAWWHSFGFNEKEGWREDGFSVAFAPEERQYARQHISLVKVTPWSK